MDSLRRITLLILVLYAALVLYVVIAVSRGVGYHPLLTPLNTLLAFSFAILHGSQRLGWKNNLLLLAITFTVSLAFESVGVATGWVYGSYHYTDKLGVKFLGLVPLLIPLAWFMMSYPALIIAYHITKPRRALAAAQLWGWRVLLAGVGALAMTAWDLAMDPMMVAGEHWVWDQPGAYFGIPLQNFWGWWLTILVVFGVFLGLGRISPAALAERSGSFDRLAVLSYAITGFSTVAVNFQIDLAGPALVGIFAMLPWVIAGWPEST
jgi:uncharacterized membrane protein